MNDFLSGLEKGYVEALTKRLEDLIRQRKELRDERDALERRAYDADREVERAEKLLRAHGVVRDWTMPYSKTEEAA